MKDFVSDDAGVGRSAPLPPPRGTGGERVATLSRSPGAVLMEILVSDETGVGRSAPLHPSGDGGARGLRPSRALPGLF